jgi:hypothetical protein
MKNLNPWNTEPSTTSTSNTPPIDMSPTAILDRDAALAAAIRKGLIKISYAQSCRLAVAKAVAAGLVKHDNTPVGGSKV